VGQVPAGKDHGERNAETVDVAVLQQVADFLILKELMNLVFTENDV